MRGTSKLWFCLFSFIAAPRVFASEQQPFEFGEMSAPQYTLPSLPYAYDVSILLALPRARHIYLQVGVGTPHLSSDHGAASQQASPDLHHQLERSFEKPG